MELEFDILEVLAIAHEAGEAILKHYVQGVSIELKADQSPVTIADKAAHEIISKGLMHLTPDIPVISEEDSLTHDYAFRKDLPLFWLIDPLDGTKEFIARNGDFTVNIALIRDGRPIASVVHIPVSMISYTAVAGQGAYRWSDGESQILRVSPDFHNPLRIVVSRSHLDEETKALLSKFLDAEVVQRGSSIKIVTIAEGIADFYPRFGPTMEWDIAAADLILEEAGGRVFKLGDHSPLEYNKPNMLNPSFAAVGHASISIL